MFFFKDHFNWIVEYKCWAEKNGLSHFFAAISRQLVAYYPCLYQPLTKNNRTKPGGRAFRINYQPVKNGHAYTELNDPLEQGNVLKNRLS